MTVERSDEGIHTKTLQRFVLRATSFVRGGKGCSTPWHRAPLAGPANREAIEAQQALGRQRHERR